MVEKAVIWVLGSWVGLRPQTSGKNPKREDSSALGDSSLDSSLLNGSGVMFRHINFDRLPRSNINIGSVATFRHKHGIGCHVSAYTWDRLPRSGINIGSGTTFRYANNLGVGSMRGPLN
uniref:Uncharacterized protein n=1 Tax=Solanum tuberosum TaxID=4113 RepID=M1BIH5_SOLTU